MFKLTREVRFAIGGGDSHPPSRNGHGGYPPVEGLAQFFVLRITLTGPQSNQSGYVRNIVEIDQQVRSLAIPLIASAIDKRSSNQYQLINSIHQTLATAWPGSELVSTVLCLSPFTEIAIHSPEQQMMRLSHKFEFSASHRLHNPTLSDSDNQSVFGKCNNLHGHGHNYEVQITLSGKPDSTGTLIPMHQLEQIVLTHAIDKLDHKHLNIQVPEFRDLNPSVENIAMTIYSMLDTQFNRGNCKLKSVTVWETPKTWCEYSPD